MASQCCIWPGIRTQVFNCFNQDNVFNHFIQLKILSHILEKASLASYYNLALPIQGILGADLQKLKGKDI